MQWLNVDQAEIELFSSVFYAVLLRHADEAIPKAGKMRSPSDHVAPISPKYNCGTWLAYSNETDLIS